MKKNAFIAAVMVAALLAGATQAMASEVEILINKLVEKNVLTPSEAQIILDETKVQVAKEVATGQSISSPEWTQRIKWGGDVRFRTQGDWGKNNTTPNGGNNGIENQRIRERLRGRFFMEGKVNDFTYAGVRLAGGANSARSTNDTLGNTSSATGLSNNGSYFQKAPVYFDQYYIKFEAPSDLVRNYGQYFSDFKLWLGRMPNPFEYSEIMWDSDTNPGGIALQYASPGISAGYVPDFNVYSNLGMFWLDESASINTDPLLFGYQVGAKTEPFGLLGTTLNVSTTLYDFANMKNKSAPIAAGNTSSGTNSRNWIADGYKVGDPNYGNYRYEFNVFDLLLQVDNSKFMDYSFPHGFYGDFLYNAGCHEASQNKAVLIGGYIGKKKIKERGDWKIRGEWRFIERDSVPDFMPDSDFYGFGTYASGQTSSNTNGLPVEGGTNGKGINLALEYMLFKNTSLNFEYYWMEPIKAWNGVGNGRNEPWNELQIDCVTKF